MKRTVVTYLEKTCARLHHPRGCQLAKWSDALDQRWGTGVWKLNHHPEDGPCISCGRVP